MDYGKPVIMDIQFIQGNHGQYFAKELAILKHETVEPMIFYFKPPYPENELDEKTKWRQKFTYKNINGLKWNDGGIDYNNISQILSIYTNSIIYVKGLQKANFIKNYIDKLSTNIIDLEDIPNLQKLKKFQISCKVHGGLLALRCAAQNCINIYLYMLINKVIE